MRKYNDDQLEYVTDIIHNRQPEMNGADAELMARDILDEAATYRDACRMAHRCELPAAFDEMPDRFPYDERFGY